jgi:hypothetical protein
MRDRKWQTEKCDEEWSVQREASSVCGYGFCEPKTAKEAKMLCDEDRLAAGWLSRTGCTGRDGDNLMEATCWVDSD